MSSSPAVKARANSGPGGRKSITAAQCPSLTNLPCHEISRVRSAFKCCGHGVFRGLVPSRLCTEVREAARGLPSEGWQQIFNAKNQTQSGRQMAQAPPMGQSVVNEVFAFLQTRALIATKWHRLDLARHAVVLGNMTRLQRQRPHTDFEIIEFADFSPEIKYCQSFSIMVVLQRTTVYFRNVAGLLVPEVMEAGDVLVFRGDAVHCGAEWTESDQLAAMSEVGDNFNFRLFSYVPSWRKVEFLIVWKPTQRFLSSLVSLQPSKKTDTVFTNMDPELDAFDPVTFQAHMKYADKVYQFDQAAYYDGIESFPAKKTNTYAVDYATLFENVSEPHCLHFADDRADWFQSSTAYSQLQQLRRQCPCRTKAVPSQPTKRARRSSFDACRCSLLETLSDFIESFPSSRTQNGTDLIDTATRLQSQLTAFESMDLA